MARSSLCFPDPTAGWSLPLPSFCVSWSWELTAKGGSSSLKKLVKVRAKDEGRRLYLWIPSIYQSRDHKIQGKHSCEVSWIGEHCRSSYVVLNFYGQCWPLCVRTPSLRAHNVCTAAFPQKYRSNLYLKDADSPAGKGICCPLVEGDEQLTSMSGGCEMNNIPVFQERKRRTIAGPKRSDCSQGFPESVSHSEIHRQ